MEVRIKTLGGTPHSFSSPLNEPDDLRRMIGTHLSDIETVLRQKNSAGLAVSKTSNVRAIRAGADVHLRRWKTRFLDGYATPRGANDI